MKWLLIEWSESATESTKYWQAQLESQPPELRHFVHIAKARGRIEHDHRELQAELGLNHYDGRHWLGWHHNLCLVTISYALFRAEQARLKINFQCNLEPAPCAQATAGSAHQAQRRLCLVSDGVQC